LFTTSSGRERTLVPHSLILPCGIRSLPFPPPARIAQAQRVPPLIERGLVETHDGFTPDGGGHGHASVERVDYGGAIRWRHAGDEMPERHRVPRRGAGEHELEVARADVLENVKDIALTNVAVNGRVLTQTITR